MVVSASLKTAAARCRPRERRHSSRRPRRRRNQSSFARAERVAVQKMQIVVQKMQVKQSFSFCTLLLKQETNVRRILVGQGIQAQGKAAMKRCALCHGRLGLGARFRNVWNGRWWVHVRFCSVRCEGIYEVRRNEAAKHRWHTFLARGNSPNRLIGPTA